MSYSPRCKSSPFLLVAPLLPQLKIVLLLYIIHIATTCRPPHHLPSEERSQALEKSGKGKGQMGSAGLGMKSFDSRGRSFAAM